MPGSHPACLMQGRDRNQRGQLWKVQGMERLQVGGAGWRLPQVELVCYPMNTEMQQTDTVSPRHVYYVYMNYTGESKWSNGVYGEDGGKQ